ncbi:hypothetical protein DCCM_4297 [Desulfocucumis palustris]|uniref:Uncharacterized protein n=1 Tax=Desulfocucumis palustris TaxID=1898651 RepID=A0A2L2XGQ0_9FIRM|nr:hypothetical protein [Desulfocucumis palustris]GBF35174.1 hypothetical protein DCCM_4297 [Desulfocucumis palustris]
MEAVCRCCGQTLMPEIGSKIRAGSTVFNITRGKVYEVLSYGRMSGCIVITSDLGDEEEYALKYFSEI